MEPRGEGAMKPRRLAKHKRIILVVLFLGLALTLFQASGLREHFTLDFLRQRVLASGALGLAAFVLMFSLGNLVQVPGLLFLGAAVLTLGRVAGGGVTYLAAVVSCGATFLSIRLVGGRCAPAVRQPPCPGPACPPRRPPCGQRRPAQDRIPNRAPAQLHAGGFRGALSRLYARFAAGAAAADLGVLPVLRHDRARSALDLTPSARTPCS